VREGSIPASCSFQHRLLIIIAVTNHNILLSRNDLDCFTLLIDVITLYSSLHLQSEKETDDSKPFFVFLVFLFFPLIHSMTHNDLLWQERQLLQKPNVIDHWTTSSTSVYETFYLWKSERTKNQGRQKQERNQQLSCLSGIFWIQLSSPSKRWPVFPVNTCLQ
jgi:hypothetical protein